MKVGVMPIPGPDAMQPSRSGPARSHMASLIPGWTKMRATAGSNAARLISAIWASVSRVGSIVRVPSRSMTLPTAPPDQSSLGVVGMGVSHKSTSSPI